LLDLLKNVDNVTVTVFRVDNIQLSHWFSAVSEAAHVVGQIKTCFAGRARLSQVMRFLSVFNESGGVVLTMESDSD